MLQVSAQSCNSRIKDLFFVSFFVCIYLKEEVQQSAAAVLHCSHSQKSLRDVNERHFTAQHSFDSP